MAEFTYGNSLICSQNSYFVSGNISDSNYFSRAGVFRVDTSGGLLWEKRIDQQHYSSSQCIIGLSQGNYLTCGGDSGGGVALRELNTNGDTLWTRTNRDTAFRRMPYMCRETRDHGFIITGAGSYTASNSEIFIMKTDQYGHTLWEKRIAGPYTADAISVDTCLDGGFVIGGTWGFPNCNAPPGSRAYLLKTDSAGNTLWQHLYCTSCDNSCGAHVIALKDNTFALCATALTGMYTWFSTGNYFVGRTDHLGNIIWQQYFGFQGYETYSTAIKQTSDGGFIMCGCATDSANATQSVGAMAKLDDIGNVLWLGNYRNVYGLHSQNYLTDIAQALDGGFIACGTVQPFTPDTGLTNMWLVKTDWFGCETNGNCPAQIMSGVEQPVDFGNDFSVYPNPSGGIFILKSSHEKYRIAVFDMMGKMIRERFVSDSDCVLDLSGEPSGLYFLEIDIGNKTVTRRIMKE